MISREGEKRGAVRLTGLDSDFLTADGADLADTRSDDRGVRRG